MSLQKTSSPATDAFHWRFRMRDAARKMEEKHFSDRTNEHVEFLPVEWRSKLTLDGGIGYGQC